MANKGGSKPISDALQLGNTLLLSNGESVTLLGACPLRQLEHMMELYNGGAVGYKLAYVFAKGNETMRDGLLELLYIASGEKVTQEQWLDKLTTADETAVYDALNRFFGLVVIDTAAEKVE